MVIILALNAFTFCIMKRPGVFLLLLEGMLVHCKDPPLLSVLCTLSGCLKPALIFSLNNTKGMRTNTFTSFLLVDEHCF